MCSNKGRITDIRRFSSFDRDLRVARYRSDAFYEKIIDALNEHLHGMDDEIRKTLKAAPFPPIIITGVPRSGTTLLTQLLAARYDFAYVSNLMARFYASPLTGAWLQQQLIRDDIHNQRGFSSHHGVTARVYEPHEFGYFWSRYLNFGSTCHEPKTEKELAKIKFSELNSVIREISSVFDRPVIYKCSICPFFVESLMNTTNVFLIHIKRDRNATSNSLLRVREQRLGDKKKWWSIRPHGWEKMRDQPPLRQVLWQYDSVFQAIVKGCQKFDHRTAELTLDELLRSPEVSLGNIVERYFDYSRISVRKVGIPIEPLQV